MNVCIVGAGIEGIISAIICLKYNFSIQILDKQDAFGGSWLNYATDDSILQTLPYFYNYYYILLSSRKNKKILNLMEQKTLKRKHILIILNELVSEYNLKKYTQFNTEIVNINEVNKTYKIHCKDNRVLYFDACLICSGYLMKPKIIKYNYKTNIQIYNAYNINKNVFHNKKVLIVGWGAYAIQTMITANKNNAKEIILMGRTPRVVWPERLLFFYVNTLLYSLPKTIAIIILFVFNTLWYLLNGLYKYISYDHLFKIQYLPCINDEFFNLHKKSNIFYKIDKIIKINNDTVFTRNGFKYKPDIIVFACGFKKQDFSFIDKSIRPKNNILYKSMYPLKTDKIAIIKIPQGIYHPHNTIIQINHFCTNLKQNTNPTYSDKKNMKPNTFKNIVLPYEIIKSIKN